jgi:hypothetical protein
VKVQKNKIIFILTILTLSFTAWGANKFITNQYEIKFTDSQEQNGSFILRSGEYKISYYSDEFGNIKIEHQNNQNLELQTYRFFLKPKVPNEITITINNSMLRIENNGNFINELLLDESIKWTNDLKILDNNVTNFMKKTNLSFKLDNNKYFFLLMIISIIIINFLMIFSGAFLRSGIIFIILTIFLGSFFYFVKNYYSFSSLKYYSTSNQITQQIPFEYTDKTDTKIVFKSELYVDKKSQEGLNYFGLKNLTPLPDNQLLLKIPLLNNEFVTTPVDKIPPSGKPLIIEKSATNTLLISGDAISKKSLGLNAKKIDYSKLISDSINDSVVYELSVFQWNYGLRVVNLMLLTTLLNLLLFTIFFKASRVREYLTSEINLGFVSSIMISSNLFKFMIEEKILVPKLPTSRILEQLSFNNSSAQVNIFNNKTILSNLSLDLPYLDKAFNIIEFNLLTLFFTILLLKYLSKIQTLNWASFFGRIFVVMAIVFVYAIDILTNTNMIIVLFSLVCAVIYRTQLLSQWLKLVVLVFTLALLYPGFFLLPLIFINQNNKKLILKVYTVILMLFSTLHLSFSVNVINSQLLIYLINNFILSFGTLLIVSSVLLLAVVKKSHSYGFISIFQLILIGFIFFVSANGSILISLLSLIVFISFPKILEGLITGVDR